MYLTATKRHWVLDIETDGLRDEATQVFVVCVENAITDEKLTFTDKDTFNDWLKPDYLFVGHNIIGFDLPVLNRFWGSKLGVGRVVDTFVLSMLYSPSFAGGHSLEAWGVRLKYPKLPFKDFTHYSEEMLKYCQNDVSLTKRLFLALTERMKQVGFTEKGPEIEHLSWNIIQNKQKRHGFPFNYQGAHELLTNLRQREEDLKREIYDHWPPQLLPIREFAKSRKNDGTPTKDYIRHTEQYPRVEHLDGGRYRVFDWVDFNLGSPVQRIGKLLEAGWTPTSYTKKGNPQVDEESLIKFAESSDTPAALALAKWVVTNSRANMIRTWMNAYNEKTGALHGNLWLASTLRYRHDNPNSANIPSVRLGVQGPRLGEDGSWTYESRDLWTCGNSGSHSLVGVDAKGIQLRVLAHYLEDEQFNEAILSEDPHSANQQRLGLSSRSLTKTITYATLMGAGDARIAAEADVPLKEAKAAKQAFFKQVPGLQKLITRLQSELTRTGRITLCDGSRVMVSSPHMVIPYLLQGDESRIMKQAAIYLDQEVRRNKIDANKVADVHDEFQFAVKNEDVESFVKLALSVFPRAGNTFNYKIPIEGAASVGKTWSQTH